MNPFITEQITNPRLGTLVLVHRSNLPVDTERSIVSSLVGVLLDDKYLMLFKIRSLTTVPRSQQNVLKLITLLGWVIRWRMTEVTSLLLVCDNILAQILLVITSVKLWHYAAVKCVSRLF